MGKPKIILSGGVDLLPAGAGGPPMVVAELLFGRLDRSVRLRVLILFLLQPLRDGRSSSGTFPSKLKIYAATVSLSRCV